MKNAILLCLFCLSLGIVAMQAAPTNASRFGFYWRNDTLPYDTEFSYFYDVAVYPDGIFADCAPHSFAYVTAQNKHIGYDGITYGVELVLQYGYGVNNFDSVKRVWLESHDDARFLDPWIDIDADGEDYWEMSNLEANGYFTTEQDTDGDTLQFLRVQQQTIFISETSSPVTSTWENRFFFYNFVTDTWDMKMKNSFAILANRQAVRNATYEQGSGIWAGILETDGDEVGPPDFGRPPVRKVVYRNRWIRVVDNGVTSTPNLTLTNNGWSAPDPASYHLFYLSEPVFSEYGAGTESVDRRTFQVIGKPVQRLKNQKKRGSNC